MTNLLTEGLQQRIAAHNTGRHTFHSWAESEELHFDVVSNDMHPHRSAFWGYCQETGTYFISSSIPIAHRIAVLQMEHHKIRHNLSNLDAISFALEQPANIGRGEFLATLRPFYQEEALSFDESDNTLSDSEEDILATVRYLEAILNQ